MTGRTVTKINAVPKPMTMRQAANARMRVAAYARVSTDHVDLVQDCIAENARVAQNQEKYMEKYSSLTSRYGTAKEKLDKVTGEIAGRTARARELRRFADRLKESGTVTEFDAVIWSDFVDYVTVDSKKRMTFMFRDGTDITV